MFKWKHFYSNLSYATVMTSLASAYYILSCIRQYILNALYFTLLYCHLLYFSFFYCSAQWIVSIGHCIVYSVQLRCTKTYAVPCIVYVLIRFDIVVQCQTGTHSNNNHWFKIVNFWNETCCNIQWTVECGVVPFLLILNSFKIMSKRRVIRRL